MHANVKIYFGMQSVKIYFGMQSVNSSYFPCFIKMSPNWYQNVHLELFPHSIKIHPAQLKSVGKYEAERFALR